MDQSEAEVEAAAAKVVSPTTEWRIKAEFYKLMDNIKLTHFLDQCAVLLQLLSYTSRLTREKRATPCYGKAKRSTMYDMKYKLRYTQIAGFGSTQPGTA